MIRALLKLSLLMMSMHMAVAHAGVLSGPHYDIQLFTTSSQPFTGISADSPVSICHVDIYLDDLASIQKTLTNHALSIHSSDDAKTLVERERAQARSKHHKQSLGASYACTYKAKMLGLTKVPAIVFMPKNPADHHTYVVYGVSDIRYAKKIMMDHRGLSNGVAQHD